MSEILFYRSGLSPEALKLRLAVLGAVGGLALAVLSGVLGLQTMGVLGGDVRITVRLPTVGDTLGINSDVKFNGLRVGRVVDVDPGVDADGPSAEVVVLEEHAAQIPAAVRARVLPGTLFGNEYVDLVPDGTRAPVTAAHLDDGHVVPADTTRRTIRLMDTFSATQRLLAAVDPDQWDAALSQLAGALDGRGEEVARFFGDADRFLLRWARWEPQVMTDLDLLARNADILADLEPALVRTVRDSVPLARTLVRHEGDTTDLLDASVALLDGEDGITEFLAANGPETARLLNATAATLDAFADRHRSFELLLGKVPQLLFNGAAAVQNGRIQMEGVLSPQMLDPYDAQDCPRYRGLPGPNCPGAPR